ncbi:peptidoglycan bridge formation glycyltransferase FemA/FemB family protein [candidate division KSB1 bacterium]|nr:peptidoglycan bridge formation glycyltransferase FemA/FemB family protein [candidate division KSB1 bacterium]
MEIKSSITGTRGISLPFSDYCDPLFTQSIDMNEILNFLITSGKKASWKYFEIRASNNFFEALKPSKQFYHHVLRLSNNENDILAKFRSSTRRNIDKAIRCGVKTKIGNSAHDIVDYYRLHCKTRKYHGLPPQPFKFFRNIFKFILSNNLGIIVLATYNNKCIAGNVYFHFGKKAYYKYGASDRKYQHFRASNLVMWEAIKYYIQNSYESLCFGRTDLDDQGLLQYKNGWGAECTMLKYYKYDLKNDRFMDEKLITNKTVNIFKHFPMLLLRMIGLLLYRHMG